MKMSKLAIVLSRNCIKDVIFNSILIDNNISYRASIFFDKDIIFSTSELKIPTKATAAENILNPFLSEAAKKTRKNAVAMSNAML